MEKNTKKYIIKDLKTDLMKSNYPKSIYGLVAMENEAGTMFVPIPTEEVFTLPKKMELMVLLTQSH
ncbi:aminopeptidase [Anaerobacillus sp. HL2]|nr:aminopeptidase [Anaerobacillus sp. HL2]